MADKEYLLGNKARELLEYTNQATKTVSEDISRKDVRQIFQKMAALDDIRDIQKVCSESIAYLDRTHREGFTKALYRCYGEDMRLLAKSIMRDIHAANSKMFQTEYEERLRLLGVVLDVYPNSSEPRRYLHKQERCLDPKGSGCKKYGSVMEAEGHRPR